MAEQPNKFQAALVAGLIFGALSAIPFVNLLNACCCLWVVIGGAIAARTLVNRSPIFPVSSGDGAAVGALSGVIMSLVYLVLGVPIHLLTRGSSMEFMRRLMEGIDNPEFRRGMEQMMRNQQYQSLPQILAGALFGWIVVSAVAIGFATLGGVIGVALFEKRKGQQMPPPGPPPGYQGYPPPPPPGN